MFHPERYALIGGVDFQHDGVDLLALFENVGGVGDLSGPRHVGDVNHAVDAFLDFDERAEVGEVAHLAADPRTGRIFLRHVRPRVGFQLASAEGNLLLLTLDLKNQRVDLVSDLQHV